MRLIVMQGLAIHTQRIMENNMNGEIRVRST
jgi:hypothetical protein